MRDQEIVGLYEAYNSIYSNVNEEVEQLDEITASMGRRAKEYNRKKEQDAHMKRLAAHDEKMKTDPAYRDSHEAARKVHSREEVEVWVNSLVEGGYDLSEYTWDDMCEMYMNEVEQLDEISLKTKMKAYAATQDPESDYTYGSKVHAQGDRLRKAIVKKHGEKAGENADAHADASHWGRKDASGKKKGYAQSRTQTPNKYRTRADGKMHGQDQNKLKAKLKRRIGEEYVNADLFDTILEYLVAEGYADTNEAAITIMANMSEEWRQNIVEEVISEGEKPFPHEKVKAKQVELRDKGSAGLNRRMKMGMARRRATEAEKTGGSQQNAGKGWYHGK